jgi:S1-C subfamily serine protease
MAGLIPGDVVLAVNDHEIRDDTDLIGSLARLQPGQKVRLTVWRDRRERAVEATLGEFAHADPIASAPALVRNDSTAGLGFTVEPVSAALLARIHATAFEGVVVKWVDPQGPVAGWFVGMDACRDPRARLQEGQSCGTLLLAINGEKVSSPGDVDRIAKALKPGAAVSLRLFDATSGIRVHNFRTLQ